jgi:hypothetical protein
MSPTFLSAVDQRQPASLEIRNAEVIAASARCAVESAAPLFAWLEEWDQVNLELDRQLETLC